MDRRWAPAPMADEEDDRARYEREVQSQRHQQGQLERSAVALFSEWLGEIAKRFVVGAVQSFWSWFRGFFV